MRILQRQADRAGNAGRRGEPYPSECRPNRLARSSNDRRKLRTLVMRPTSGSTMIVNVRGSSNYPGELAQIVRGHKNDLRHRVVNLVDLVRCRPAAIPATAANVLLLVIVGKDFAESFERDHFRRLVVAPQVLSRNLARARTAAQTKCSARASHPNRAAHVPCRTPARRRPPDLADAASAREAARAADASSPRSRSLRIRPPASAHMVVNMASLPSTVTLVTGAVRSGAGGSGTCPLDISGPSRNTAAAHNPRHHSSLKLFSHELCRSSRSSWILSEPLVRPLRRDRHWVCLSTSPPKSPGAHTFLWQPCSILSIYKRTSHPSRNQPLVQLACHPTLATLAGIC